MCDGFWSGAAEEEYWIKWKKCGVIFVIFFEIRKVRYNLRNFNLLKNETSQDY